MTINGLEAIEEEDVRPKSSLKKKNTVRSSSMPFNVAHSHTKSRLNLDLTDVFAEI